MNLESDFSTKFDNYGLENIPHLVLLSRKPNVMPDREIKTVSLIRNHGSIVVGDRFTKKVIPIYAIIMAPSRQAYEETMDELKYRLSNAQRPLSLVQAGKERIYTATLENMAETFVERGNSFITMYFACYDPFGRDASVTTYISDVYTTATKTFDHVFGGQAASKPLMTLTFSALTGGTNKSVFVGNGVSGQGITVTRTWSAGDVLRIDMESQDVRVNGTVVDFTGFFATFDPRTAYAQANDNFTTRSAQMRIEYSPRYT